MVRKKIKYVHRATMSSKTLKGMYHNSERIINKRSLSLIRRSLVR